MIKWLDLGMSDPLTLGMAHPLADRLECLASPKVNKGLSRSLTAGLIVSVGLITAPLTIAEAHPEHDLPDTVVSMTKKNSVIEIVKTDDGGETIKKRYEIKLDGDTFEAYEVDVAGRKTKIDPEDIEGFDLEKAKKSKSWSFEINDDNNLKFQTGKDIAKKHGVYSFLHSDGDEHSTNRQSIRVFSADKDLKEALKGLESLEGLEKLEALKSLEGLPGLSRLSSLEKLSELSALSKLEGLKDLETLRGNIIIESLNDGDGPKTFSWSGDFSEFPERFEEFKEREFFKFESGEGNAFFLKQGETASKEARLAIAKSMLENAQNMLQDIDDLEESGSELRRAKRDLEKARKALKNAEEKSSSLSVDTSRLPFTFDKNASYVGDGMVFSNNKLIKSNGPVTVLQDGKDPIVIENGKIIKGPKAEKAIKEALGE